MQALTLPASRGWRWLSEGFGIFRKKQLILALLVLGYWMLMAVINSVPYIGQLAATLLIPVFSVSLMNACRLIEQGALLPPQLLFSGFYKNLRTLLVLGAVYVAVTVVILGISAMIDDGVLFQLIVLGQRPGEQALTSGEVVLAGQVALALFAPVIMAYWYAPVLVAWHDLSAVKALFFSFVACMRNWRAFLVYSGMILLAGAFLPGLVLGLLSSFFSDGGDMFSTVFTVVIVLVFLPSLYGSFYVSYRDVFVTINENA
jgi:hypothetical protein